MSFFFFFNDTATTEIYTLSLHDALPICADCTAQGQGAHRDARRASAARDHARAAGRVADAVSLDRKSTRLNSSHTVISYAVFCLKKKKSKRAAALTRMKRCHVAAQSAHC